MARRRVQDPATQRPAPGAPPAPLVDRSHPAWDDVEELAAIFGPDVIDARIRRRHAMCGEVGVYNMVAARWGLANGFVDTRPEWAAHGPSTDYRALFDHLEPARRRASSR